MEIDIIGINYPVHSERAPGPIIKKQASKHKSNQHKQKLRINMELSINMSSSEVVSAFFANPDTPRNKYINKFTENYEPETPAQSMSIADKFLRLVDELNYRLSFFHVPPPVNCIYNSTEYARYTFEMYVRRYCDTTKHIMFFGMNPGPWGMSQTGVPFGEVNAVRDWLKIEGPVQKPPRELRARPVHGFHCTRSEMSGKRLWGLFRELCGEPDNFFSSTFIYNYLPQQWMKENGCNVTPSDFKSSEMQTLYDMCDPMFCQVVELYQVQIVVAIGKFCETRAKKALKQYLPHRDIKVVYLPHPSPRTVNNNNWSEKALEHLRDLNLLQFYSRDVKPLDLTT